jgi:hypothetical protein
VARTGAIAPLVAVVKEGAAEVQHEAAGALYALVANHPNNQATVAKLGGIEPLVQLLVSVPTVDVERVVGALRSLSYKHTENRNAVSKQLVGHLSSRISMGGVAGASVRLLTAVGLLAHDEYPNQLALGRAGVLTPLIMWLSGGFDVNKSDKARGAQAEAQCAAAKAVLALTVSNGQMQEGVAKANGVPPLIELCSSGTRDTQRAAARTLWHLAGNAEVGSLIATAGGCAVYKCFPTHDRR